MENKNVDEIFKLKAKKIYDNCELTGIKIISDQEEISNKFGNEIANILSNNNGYDSAIGGKNEEGLRKNPQMAEFYLSQLVKIDALEHEIIGQTNGMLDEKKKLDFELYLTDKDGKEHAVSFKNFQFGFSDMTKGFNNLLLQADSIDQEKNNKTTLKTKDNKLDKICAIPSELINAKIANKSHDILKSLKQVVPAEISPEASAFLKSFIDNFLDSKQYANREQFIAEHEREQRRQKNKEAENKKQDLLKKDNSSNSKNSNAYETKSYDQKSEPEYIKEFKADSKKFNDYAKRFDEINSDNSKLNDTQKQEEISKLEKEYKVSVNEFLGIQQEQVKIREQAIADLKKKELKKDEIPKQTKLSYDNFFANPNSQYLMAITYDKNQMPDYIKDFKSDVSKIKAYEKEYKAIFNEKGEPFEAQNSSKFQESVKNLERSFKISIPEFLGIKQEQSELKREAIKNIKEKGGAKTSKQQEQIRTNIPSDRGL